MKNKIKAAKMTALIFAFPVAGLSDPDAFFQASGDAARVTPATVLGSVSFFSEKTHS